MNEELESDPVEEDKHGGNGENENQMKTVVTKGALFFLETGQDSPQTQNRKGHHHK